MFLSQLLVNPGSHPDKPRPGIDWSRQTYRVHQRIWMAFPDAQRLKADPFFLGSWSAGEGAKPPREECGFLFRIESDLPLRVLVQSVAQPNWDYAFQNAPHLLAGPPQVREFDPTFVSGHQYRFRLVMQMVTRRTVPKGKVGDADSKRRTEHPILCLKSIEGNPDRQVPDPDFTAWRTKLASVAAESGFELSVEPEQLQVQPVTNLHMKPEAGQPPQRFHAAMFEGVIVCKDANRLREAVVNGVGRGKAFGMGLLSLAATR
jgi:CRISPR system Cascade subunit CasE